ncbi:MAG: ChaN family lipoprotein [Deltaproteobacteria bacterium]|nr:ChaN family lipoprotein [Deltaproteobacteria bacterium]
MATFKRAQLPKFIDCLGCKLTLSALLAAIMGVACSPNGTAASQAPAKKDDGVVQTGQLPRTGLLDGANLKATTIESVVGKVNAGGVLVLGELHGNATHYFRQKGALSALAATGRCTVSVGLEFLSWVHQASVDDFFDGKLAEADFLKAAEWGGNPFSDYRDQALFSRQTGGRLIGLNAPRTLTGAISKRGVEGLTAEEVALMPPEFSLGSKGYRERFDSIMGGHIPAQALDRYFAAQSTWDETMAWQVAKFLGANPTHCVAVIVGDFHVNFGGGLPDRLRARGIGNVVTISQVDTFSLTEPELTAELGPDSRYGDRADGIWLSSTDPGPSPTVEAEAVKSLQGFRFEPLEAKGL